MLCYSPFLPNPITLRRNLSEEIEKNVRKRGKKTWKRFKTDKNANINSNNNNVQEKSIARYKLMRFYLLRVKMYAFLVCTLIIFVLSVFSCMFQLVSFCCFLPLLKFKIRPFGVCAFFSFDARRFNRIGKYNNIYIYILLDRGKCNNTHTQRTKPCSSFSFKEELATRTRFFKFLFLTRLMHFCTWSKSRFGSLCQQLCYALWLCCVLSRAEQEWVLSLPFVSYSPNWSRSFTLRRTYVVYIHTAFY